MLRKMFYCFIQIKRSHKLDWVEKESNMETTNLCIFFSGRNSYIQVHIHN